MRIPRSVARTVEVLEAAGIPYALIGAGALAVRGYTRATADLDFLATRSDVLADETWQPLRGVVRVDIRRGDEDDPLRGVVRIGTERSMLVDVVVPRGRWLDDVLARATREDLTEAGLPGVRVPVATMADLVLLKVDAAGTMDLADVSRILSENPTKRADLEAHVERYLPQLSDYSVSRWQKLLADG